jgi:hypothetical protein
MIAMTAAQCDSILRPSCSQCGSPTLLFGIEAEPDRPGYELLTFVCANCQHIETAVGKAATTH